MRLTAVLLALATLAAALFGAAAPALAQEGVGTTFYIRNQTNRAMVMELHGRESGRVWPGEGEVYLVEPGEKKSVQIDCEQGETICYGAWVNGNDRISFGVGPDADRQCRSCCSICVAKTTTTIDMPQ